jgi:hypothetical protein
MKMETAVYSPRDAVIAEVEQEQVTHVLHSK